MVWGRADDSDPSEQLRQCRQAQAEAEAGGSVGALSQAHGLITGIWAT